MTLVRVGGYAALVCGGTYLVGFVLLVTLLAPFGYGTATVDSAAVATLISARPGILIAWNSVIYIANALALTVLVVALAHVQHTVTPGWSAVTRAFGLIWGALVLGAGMIANVAVERTAALHASDPAAAADLWAVLHTVELGLGGGNEIAGGAWMAGVSVAGLLGRGLSRPVCALGLLSGLGGLATVVPALGDTAGAVFGLGATAWFIAIGVSLLRRAGPAVLRAGAA